MRRLSAAVLLFFGLASAALAQQISGPVNSSVCTYNATPPTLSTGTFGYTQCSAQGGLSLDTTQGVLVGTAGAPAVDVLTTQGPASGGAFPSVSTPTTNSATGTTGATAATLAAITSKFTYLCGFTITSDATAALAGTATVTGVVGGTMSFIQNVGSATAAGILTQNFAPCLQSSAVNTAIVINSIAAGTGGNTTVAAWGYQQ